MKLSRVLDKLIEQKLDFTYFKEADLDNQLTAIACAPVSGKDREFFAKYPLMRCFRSVDPNNQKGKEMTQINTEKTVPLIKAEHKKEVFKSKWGFHPCDRETYLKLKKLNHWIMRSEIEFATWQRFYRKQPHNRKGSPPKDINHILYRTKDTDMKPEYMNSEMAHFLYTDKVVCEDNGLIDFYHIKERTFLKNLVRNNYRFAKYPTEKEEQVIHLTISKKVIDNLYDHMQNFFG